MRVFKISNKRLAWASFVMATVVATYSFALQTVFAATGQIYLTPSSSSLSYGSNVKLNLRINPGTTVDGVQATVNFDTTKLQYVGTDTSNSAFSVQLQQSVSGGTISIARGDFSGGVSSDAQIAGITFKSLVYSGSGSVTLTNANATSAGSYTNPSVGNAIITLTAGSCPAGQTGTPPSCVTPAPSSPSGGAPTGTTPKPSTPAANSSTSAASAGGTTAAPAVPQSPAVGKPIITKQSIQYTKLELSISTTQTVQVYLEYGLAKNLGQQTQLSTTPGTVHTLSLDEKTVIPGQTYYYRVVARDAAGNITAGDVQKVTAKGMTVRATILDKNKKPLANKSVTLHSTPITAKTDNHGVVTFVNVTPGKHEIMYATDKKTYVQPIDVSNNIKTVGTVQSSAVQDFSVVYSFAQGSSLARLLLLVLVVAFIATVGYYLFKKLSGRNGDDSHITPEYQAIIGGRGSQGMRPLQVTPSPSPTPAPRPTPVAPATGTSTSPVNSATVASPTVSAAPVAPTPPAAAPTTTRVEVR